MKITIITIRLLLNISKNNPFSFFALILPSLATNHIFENQINVLYGRTGGAVFEKGLFFDIFNNNVIVMIVILITAIVLQ
jgi:hypothetical protein